MLGIFAVMPSMQYLRKISITEISKSALEAALSHDRLHRIELKLSRFACHRDAHVIADDLHSHLSDDFGDDGVHFAGHNGRPRLAGGEVDFDAGARTA